MKWVCTDYCTVQSTGWGLYGAVLAVQSDSSRREGPAIPLLHTLRVDQSVAEGAARCWDSGLQGVGLLHQQQWQLNIRLLLKHSSYELLSPWPENILTPWTRLIDLLIWSCLFYFLWSVLLFTRTHLIGQSGATGESSEGEQSSCL